MIKKGFNNKQKKVIDIFGWFGAVLILFAFIGNNFGFTTTMSLSYILPNIIGSIFTALDAYASKNYQPVVINFFWISISFINLLKVFIS